MESRKMAEERRRGMMVMSHGKKEGKRKRQGKKHTVIFWGRTWI